MLIYLNGEKIENLVIPNSVTSIGDYAFDGCSGLNSVEIPNSVRKIGAYAFADCRCNIYILGKDIYFGAQGIFTTDNVYGFSYLRKGTPSWNNFYPFDQPLVRIGPTEIRVDSIKLQYYDDEIISYTLDNNYSGLKPSTKYNLVYTMYTSKGDTIKGYYAFETLSLKLTSRTPKVINQGEVIVAATTNLFDETANVGFLWRKTDAPDEVPSKSAVAMVYDGMVEGIIKNIDVNSYYKVRPYYRSDNGTTYYGSWIGFDPSDFSYFEPTVKTYNNVEISDGVAKLVGYALKGSDDITEQGFEYWNIGNNSTINDIPGNDVHTIMASGQRMEAELQNLDGGTSYGYRAYVKTSKGTSYGEQYSFLMPGISLINELATNPVSQGCRNGVYTIQGHKVADDLSDCGSLPRGIYIVNGRKMVVK